MSTLRERSKGRWRAMLPSLGVDGAFLTGKHTACPVCRDGRDRFRFDDKDGVGTWICSFCGAGDGIKLVMLVNGWDFKRAAVEIEKHVGQADYQPPKKERSEAAKRTDMNRVWQEAAPVQSGDPVAHYLGARCGVRVFPACLRSTLRLRYYDEAGSSWHPAMVAMVVDAGGQPVNLHRTYLSMAGTKAALDEPRRTMPGDIPKGSAIRLGYARERE